MEFLKEYGDSDAKYEKLFDVAAIALVACLVLGVVYYVFFRNWRQEQQVHQFLGLLQQEQYPEAYTLWGCSVEKPCQYYPYEEFLEDWGPDGLVGRVKDYNLGRSYSQGSGVLITLKINGKPQPNLWVDRDTEAVGFSPY